MSLLLLDSKEKEMALAQRVFEQQFEKDRKLHSEYDERRKKLMLQDILYNLENLQTAVRFDADQVFLDYARWIFRLLVHRMTDLPAERIAQHVVMHYEILKEVLGSELPEDEARKTTYHLDNAIHVTQEALRDLSATKPPEKDQHAGLRQRYLQFLLDGDRRGATRLIQEAVDSGVPLEEIYLEVFQETMYDVGNLWHEGKITVDKEHYCTAVTQGIMAQFYAVIFATPRKGFSLLACCVGNELHEMGIRALCDLFELNGWDSVYLGAAVPTENIIHGIKENRPDLVGLSVTMPHHLTMCHDIVQRIKAAEGFPPVKIALGGRAFKLAPDLYERWGADVFAVDGRDLLHWANQTFNSPGE